MIFWKKKFEIDWKIVDYFSQSVYTMVRSKCLPLADGAGYK